MLILDTCILSNVVLIMRNFSHFRYVIYMYGSMNWLKRKLMDLLWKYIYHLRSYRVTRLYAELRSWCTLLYIHGLLTVKKTFEWNIIQLFKKIFRCYTHTFFLIINFLINYLKYNIAVRVILVLSVNNT